METNSIPQVVAGISRITWLEVALPWLFLFVVLILVYRSLPKVASFTLGLKPVHFDGMLAIISGVSPASLSVLNDDAYKYLRPWLVWGMRGTIIVVAAAASSLAAFRSKSFSDHKQAQADIASGKVTEIVSDTKIHSDSTQPTKTNT